MYRKKKMEENARLNLVIVGNPYTGKTSLVARFTRDDFLPQYVCTSAPEFNEKHMIVDGKHVRITVVDTVGQQYYHTVTSSIFRHSSGVMVLYDITNPASFNDVEGWIERIRGVTGDSRPILLVGNKTDRLSARLPREAVIAKDRAEVLAECNGVKFTEISAKTGENVQNAFKMLIDDAMQQYMPSENGLLKVTDDKSSRSCCNL